MLTAPSFFDTASYAHHDLFAAGDQVWDALKSLKAYMDEQTYPDLGPLVQSGRPLTQTLVWHDNGLHPGDDMVIEFGNVTKGGLKVYKAGRLLEGAGVIMAGTVLNGGRISLGRGALIESGAFVQSPAIIGDRTEVRHGAYLRGYCLVGDRCVAGHVTEVKHTIFLDDAKAGHFAYLGDSILGNQVNLGAGTKLANLKFVGGDIRIKTPQGSVPTGLRKLGAILGDQVQTGCNAVTSPGTLMGKKSMLLPNTTAPSGHHGAHSIIR